MAHTSDRERLPERELLKLHGLMVKVEPYPNGIRALAVYRGDDRLYHGEPVGARPFVDGYDVAKAEPIEDLLHDPRISDVHVLEAARALLAERGADTENLGHAIWCLEGQPEE